jgi:NADPH:quinone reductase-like Zn-dependent oxidoreductase
VPSRARPVLPGSAGLGVGDELAVDRAIVAASPRQGGTVKAVVQDRYGEADVLALRDVEAPVPGDADVLIRVRAAGVDPGTWHLMTGRPYLVRVMGFGLRAPRVKIRGRDVAGTVRTVGKDVRQFKPGDDVYGTVEGSFAELACAAAARFALKPGNLSFEQAAAVPISGMTALVAVRDRGRVRPGQHVLVVGAGGGVGSFAVQLAKAMGAHVTGVCSSSKAELVRSIGADDVIDYTREDFTDGRRQFDLIIDTAGRRPLARLRRALAADGVLVIVGGEGGGRWLGGFQRQLGAPFRSMRRKQKLIGLMYRETQDLLLALTELIETGKVTPVIDRTYPLGQAADAISYLKQGHAAGKVVLTVP